MNSMGIELQNYKHIGVSVARPTGQGGTRGALRAGGGRLECHKTDREEARRGPLGQSLEPAPLPTWEVYQSRRD